MLSAAKNGRGARETFLTLHKSCRNPIHLPDSLQLAFTTMQQVLINELYITCQNGIYLSTLNQFSVCWIFIFRLLKSNLEVRQDTPEFLILKFLSTRLLTLEKLEGKDLQDPFEQFHCYPWIAGLHSKIFLLLDSQHICFAL